MTLQIGLLLSLIGVTLVLFSLERLPPDVIGLGAMLALVVTDLLSPAEAFAGFGSATVLMLLGLFILTAALERTGVVDLIGREIIRRTGSSPSRWLASILAVTAALSALISNTATTALFVPIVTQLARRARVSVSRVLLPVAFSAILASSITLVSSSTNIVISGLMTDSGLAPIGVFELAPVGLPIAALGLLYVLTLGRRLIPERATVGDASAEFGLRPYLTELAIRPRSPLDGKTLAEAALGRDLDLTVLRVIRGERKYLAPRANLRLQAGDVLLVQGMRDELLRVKDTFGIDIRGDANLTDQQLESADEKLVEAILLRGSPLVGRTLRQARFRERYGVQVLGINRRGKSLLRQMSRIALRTGDQLLIQGNRTNISLLDETNTLRVIGAVVTRRPHRRLAPVAIAAFVGAIALGASGVIGLPVAVLLGALVAFVARCITPEEAYRRVAWRALILIGSMLAMGTAMVTTGTASFLAAQIIGIVGSAGPVALLTAFFVLTLLLTQPLSNQAAAAVVVPVAIQAARQLGLNPRTFSMMIAVAASCSFLTPLEPACLLVYGPGHYRFRDFLRVGAPLTVLVYCVGVWLVPLVWPLS
jgi:di/tricarboxylate transporter